MRLSRKQRSWLSAIGLVVVPLVIDVSGVQGFGPVFAVCAGAILWTIFLFRGEISRVRIVSETDTERHTERPFWLILPGVAMVLLAFYPFVNLYLAATGHIAPLTPNDLLQTHIHDRSVYIADLARSGPIIENMTFENVTFVGPAVVTFLEDSYVNGVKFEAYEVSPDSFFLEVQKGTQMVGLIGFRKSVIRNCKFVRVQVAGWKETIEMIKAEMARTRPVSR